MLRRGLGLRLGGGVGPRAQAMEGKGKGAVPVVAVPRAALAAEAGLRAEAEDAAARREQRAAKEGIRRRLRETEGLRAEAGAGAEMEQAAAAQAAGRESSSSSRRGAAARSSRSGGGAVEQGVSAPYYVV